VHIRFGCALDSRIYGICAAFIHLSHVAQESIVKATTTAINFWWLSSPVQGLCLTEASFTWYLQIPLESSGACNILIELPTIKCSQQRCSLLHFPVSLRLHIRTSLLPIPPLRHHMLDMNMLCVCNFYLPFRVKTYLTLGRSCMGGSRGNAVNESQLSLSCLPIVQLIGWHAVLSAHSYLKPEKLSYFQKYVAKLISCWI
jgi:hypothetical protein